MEKGAVSRAGAAAEEGKERKAGPREQRQGNKGQVKEQAAA